MTSRTGKVLGGLFLVAAFAGMIALVLELRGVSPATLGATALGSFLGLISLSLELGMLVRSARTFHAQGVQTTFMSFMMRLVIVAPTTLLLMQRDFGLDPQAFALSYLATFFLYMCWLTWATYHAPVHYKPKAATTKLLVKDNRSALADAGAWSGLR